jgi:hypothetical protein
MIQAHDEDNDKLFTRVCCTCQVFICVEKNRLRRGGGKWKKESRKWVGGRAECYMMRGGWAASRQGLSPGTTDPPGSMISRAPLPEASGALSFRRPGGPIYCAPTRKRPRRNRGYFWSKNFRAMAPCVAPPPARSAAARNADSTSSSREAPAALAPLACASMQ